ncbi:MAG TPA: hypothetical protein VGR02_02140 [Thermoanaerobaculia bacterium]|jgi:hypothetical protein|nr:hypothetical protein [Thermoanaerobaculia bacterium]
MRTLPAILLSLLVVFPLFADLPVAAPALRPATGSQYFPVLASNGTDALAAWRDDRAMVELPSLTPTSPEREVYAARIAADGTPGENFDVTPSVEEDIAPAVVWNGDEYVVAHLMTPRFGFEGGIRFTRVKPGDAGDNRLIARSEYAPAPQFGFFGSLALAWNGEEYLAVVGAQFAADNTGVFALRVDRSFHPIGSAFLIASGQTGQPAVASDGNSFLVTWWDARRIGAATVSAGGSVAVQPFLSEAPASGAVSAPAMVWNGRRYLVTWTDPVVHARFVEREGTPSAAVLDLFSAGRGTAVAWNGSEYLVPFVTEGDRFDLYALRLDAEGKVLDAQPFPIAASDAAETTPAAVAVGNRFLVAWSDDETIRSAVISGSVPQQQAVVANSLGTQLHARGVFDGTNFAFTWLEDGKVYFGRVTPEGQPLDGGGTLLGSGFETQLAWNGQQYVVAFGLTNGSQSGVVRIDRDGKVLDLAPRVVPIVSALATDGRDFLLLTRTSVQPARIRPLILTAQGELLQRPSLPDLPFDSLYPAVSWNGTHYVVVYTQATEPFCFKCNQKYELHTVLLDRAGNPASPIRTIVAATGFPSIFVQARVASGGGSTVAVFASGSDATVARIAEDGVPALAPRVPDFPYPTSMIWSGSDFVVTSVHGFSAIRLSADGSLLLRFPLGDPSASDPLLVAGAPRLTIVYDRAQRMEGQGTIRRAFFDFVQERRRRAR